jgi:hypothetical protein
VSLNYRQRYQLRLVRAGISRSDPLLCSMFGMFGRLYRGEAMPAWEQVPKSRDRGCIVAWGLEVHAAMTAWLSGVLTAALVAVTAMRRSGGRRPTSGPERARDGGEVGDHQGPPGRG